VLLALGTPRLIQLWRTRRADPWDVAWIGAVLLDAAVNIAAPGAAVRYAAEIGRWYPDYALLGTFDKVGIGLGLIATTMADADNLALPILLGSVAWLLAREFVVDRAVRRALFAGLLVSLLPWAVAIALPSTMPLAQKLAVAPIPPMSGPTPHAIVLQAFVLFASVCAVLAIGFAMARRAPREAIWLVWAMAMGLASVAALGFSPTAYASGERMRFVCQIVLLIVACRVFVQVRTIVGDRPLRILLVPVTGLALLRFAAIAG
jgi:hypothetical protein